jgi:hypothetical protein
VSHPKFHLYHPVLHPDRLACAFDVVQADDREVATGDLAWITRCLAALELDVFAESWQIEPFCSPFYGNITAPHWIDRNPMAWRVTVALRTRYHFGGFPLRPAGSIVHDADPTAPLPEYWKPEHRVFTERPGVVIAAFPTLTADDARARVASLAMPAVRAIDAWELTPELALCRLHVGAVRFPVDEARLTDTVERCLRAGALCHWSHLGAYGEI